MFFSSLVSLKVIGRIGKRNNHIGYLSGLQLGFPPLNTVHVQCTVFYRYVARRFVVKSTVYLKQLYSTGMYGVEILARKPWDLQYDCN